MSLRLWDPSFMSRSKNGAGQDKALEKQNVSLSLNPYNSHCFDDADQIENQQRPSMI